MQAPLAEDDGKAFGTFCPPVAKSTASHHFRVLWEAGVIQMRVVLAAVRPGGCPGQGYAEVRQRLSGSASVFFARARGQSVATAVALVGQHALVSRETPALMNVNGMTRIVRYARDTIRALQVPGVAGRIGKAVRLRYVPNAVTGTVRAICHWLRPGRRADGVNRSQKTGLQVPERRSRKHGRSPYIVQGTP